MNGASEYDFAADTRNLEIARARYEVWFRERIQTPVKTWMEVEAKTADCSKEK